MRQWIPTQVMHSGASLRYLLLVDVRRSIVPSGELITAALSFSLTPTLPTCFRSSSASAINTLRPGCISFKDRQLRTQPKQAVITPISVAASCPSRASKCCRNALSRRPIHIPINPYHPLGVVQRAHNTTRKTGTCRMVVSTRHDPTHRDFGLPTSRISL